MQSQRILDHITAWARSRDDVRAALLTSTRSQPSAKLDPLSDYDVVFAVTEVKPFFDDRSWLADFGPVLVRYRDPLRLEQGYERFTSVTQYASDFLKIDFTVMQVGLLRLLATQPELPPELDDGYRVLLDKDDITAGMTQPTYTAFIIDLPDRDSYLQAIEVFFHETTYVAKNLWRGELLPARYSFDCMMKLRQMRQMLEWYAAAHSDEPIKAGLLGKRLAQHLPSDLWERFTATYTGPNKTTTWNALFSAIDIYREVAVATGEILGYAYPYQIDQQVCAYLDSVRSLPEQQLT